MDRASDLAPGIDNAQFGGSGTLTVTQSTFSENAGGDGNDIDNRSYNDLDTGGTIATTVAGDLFGDRCGQSFDLSATWTDNGYNAGIDGSCENGGTGDVVSALVGTDVASLSGTPATVALTTGNPGIGLIPNPTSGLCPVTADESGTATPTGDLCDAGAVEDPNLSTQSITSTSTPPAVAVIGTHYTPTATAPGGAVLFSIDTSTTNASCTIASGVVTFAAVGTCVIDANQAGSSTYVAAAQVQQSISVVQSHTSTTNSSPPSVAPPPAGGVFTSADYGKPTSVTSTSSGEEISSSVGTPSGSLASVQVDVPGGAFATPTTVSVYPINTSSLKPPPGNSYILSFAVTWENGLVPLRIRTCP